MTWNRVVLRSAPSPVINIPLRVRKDLASQMLDDAEFKSCATEDLLFLAQESKNVYVSDRASAIAVLKGLTK